MRNRIAIFVWVVGYAIVLAAFRFVQKLETIVGL
jgi:hypothetical protein